MSTRDSRNEYWKEPPQCATAHFVTPARQDVARPILSITKAGAASAKSGRNCKHTEPVQCLLLTKGIRDQARAPITDRGTGQGPVPAGISATACGHAYAAPAPHGHLLVSPLKYHAHTDPGPNQRGLHNTFEAACRHPEEAQSRRGVRNIFEAAFPKDAQDRPWNRPARGTKTARLTQ